MSELTSSLPKERLEREPDFIFEDWHFYFGEMIQWNPSSKMNFLIKEIQGELWYQDEDGDWQDYTTVGHVLKPEEIVKMIYEAYKQWHKEIEEIILGHNE